MRLKTRAGGCAAGEEEEVEEEEEEEEEGVDELERKVLVTSEREESKAGEGL